MVSLVRIARFLARRLWEWIEVSYIRLMFLSRGVYHTGDEVQYSEYIFDRKIFVTQSRTFGISGFYRVKNEEQLLAASIEAHLPYLDEIVIVYNDCSDRTPEIARSYEAQYPEKIKVYEYAPKVFPALSREHIGTAPSSPHSLVNYYNFALSKTTKTIALKLDADHIPVAAAFKKAVEDVRKTRLTTMWYFYGVNLFWEEGEYKVNQKQPFTHGYDHGFFPVSHGTYFVHRKNCEVLRLPLRMYFSRKSLGVLFYHLKGVKPDRGGDSMQLRTLQTPAGRALQDIMYNPELISWKETTQRYGIVENVPDPNIVPELQQHL